MLAKFFIKFENIPRSQGRFTQLKSQSDFAEQSAFATRKIKISD
jgi:hypothetical protein